MGLDHWLVHRRFVGHDAGSICSEEMLHCMCNIWPASECPAPGHREEITAMAISHIGDRIASADKAGVILVWDAATATVIHRLKKDYPSEAIAIAFSPDGRYFVVTDSEGFAEQYNTKTGYIDDAPFTPSQTAHSRCEMRAVAWTPDSKRYICGYEKGQVKTAFTDHDWGDAPLSGCLHLKRSEDTVNALAISPDGKSVAVAGERIIGKMGKGGRVCGFVAVYESSGNRLRWKDFATPGCDGGVTSLSFSMDGKMLVSSGKDRYVRMWDPRDGSRLKAFKQTDLLMPPRFYTSYAPNMSVPIAFPAPIVCSTFAVVDYEETSEKHKRRLAWAQGHHKRLGAMSILRILSPDLMRLLGRMV